MSFTQQFRALARYNRWMNDNLFACTSGLSEDERARDLGAFFASILGTLNHILVADRIWMTRFTGDGKRFASRDRNGSEIVVTSLRHVVYPDFAELREQRSATDEMILTWIDELSEDEFASTIRYQNSSGRNFEHPLWWTVAHMFIHQTHHRGQTTTLLNQLGHDPGVTDLAVFLRDGLDPD